MMPSRTYVEMYMDSEKHLLSRDTVDTFEKVVSGLREKPELIEEVVRNRVKMIKFIRSSGVCPYLHKYHYIMIDFVIACKLLNMPCYVAMPYRAGRDLFSKFLANMWYGDIMEKEFGGESRNEFLQKRFNIPTTNEKTYAEQIWEKQNCDLGKNNKMTFYDEFMS